MARIHPLQNGVHSLAKGLEAFDEFSKDPSNAFALKDAVLRTHHAIETITKAVLFEHNPVFLLRANEKVDTFVKRYKDYIERKNTFVVDEEITVEMLVALDRLRNLGMLSSYEDRDFFQLRDAAEELNQFRNAIQHFAINADVEIVARVLGNVVPRFIDLMDALVQSQNRPRQYGYMLMEYGRNYYTLSEYRTELEAIFPEYSRVLDLLRTRYDELIRKAIGFFKKRTFEDLEFRIRVNDHGEIGARPYRPELLIDGVFDLDIDYQCVIELTIPDHNALDESYGLRRVVEEYEASVKVSKPRIVSEDHFKIVEGSLEIQASIVLKTLEGIFQLQEAEEFVPLLRNPKLGLQASLEYRALAEYNQVHYIVHNLLSANGTFTLTFSAIPSGYDPDETKYLILGRTSCDLDEKNASFRLNAFVDLDGGLKGNRSLDWLINIRSDLQF